MSRTADLTDQRQIQPLLNPVCPTCQQPMRLALIAPHGEKPRCEVRTFECEFGHHITQTVTL